MTYSTRVKRALVLGALLLSLSAASVTVVAAAQPASNDPMRIVPADALFCARINKLSPTLGQVDQFLTGLSPVGLSMPVRAALGQFLGQPEPAGINMDGDIAVFWPLPGGEKPEPKRVGILIPLSSFQQFLTNPNVGKPDAQGILPIGPQGKPILSGIQMGGYLLVTGAAYQQALGEAKNWTTAAGAASLGQRLTPDELKRATDSPVWVYANVQVAAKMFGPQLQGKIKQVQEQIQKMQAPGQTMPGLPPAAVEMWVSMLSSFLQEAQSVSLAIEPSAAAVRLSPMVAAVPNTEMAKILSQGGMPQEQPNLTGYLENGAIMNGVARFSPALSKAVALWRVNLLTTLMGQAMSPDDLAKFKKLATDSADAFGGAGAWSMLPDPKSKPPFRLRYVFTVTDKQKFNDILDQSAKLMNEGTLADLGKRFGLKMQFTLKRNAETYKETPVDAISIALQPVDANSPQAQMMKTMFGAGLNIRLAVVNNLLVYALSADPEKDIHALIDQVKAGGPGQVPSEVQAALQLLPDANKANFFGTYNYVRAIQMAMSFMPIPAPQAEVPTRSDIAFAGDIGSNRLLLNVAVPKQQVLEMKELIMRMQQQQPQPPQQPQQPQPKAPPASMQERQNQRL
jgi:hypothetical protein